MDRSEIDSLKADLRRMQARVEELEAGEEEPVNRRNMLRGLGAAAAGVAVGSLALTRPAAAADGDPLDMGAITFAESPTGLKLNSGTWTQGTDAVPGFFVTDLPGAGTAPVNALGLLATFGAYASGDNTTNRTIAIFGSSEVSGGVGAILDGSTPLKLTDTTNAGAPGTGGWTGSFRVNGGDLWFCVDDDGFGPDPSVWRKLAGPGTAGAFHPLAPFRAYDSRQLVHPTSAVGVLNTGVARLVTIKDKINSNGSLHTANVVPANATAVALNLTVTATSAPGGFLSVNPGGDISQATSVINWFATGQTFANGLTLTLNASRQFTVVCGSGGGNAHFIIDIAGYYL